MAAKFYSVVMDPTVNVSLRNGVASAVVVAETSDDAKAALKALYGSDVDAGWDNATATEIAAGTDLEGWTLHVTVISAAGVTKADISVVGTVDDNTVDEIAALAVAALNATAAIAGADYDSSTNVLKVAETTDNLGDSTVFAAFYAPGSKSAVPGFIGTITDGGAADDALTVALAADAYTVPGLTAVYKEAK